MRGLPNINTKEDVYNMLLDFPEEGKKHVKKLYDGRFIWQTMEILKNLEDGINDERHRSFATKDADDKDIFVQQELVVDSNAFIYRIGFTDEEIASIISNTDVI